MTWAALIPIVIQYGLPFAESLWQKATSGTVPTQADWDSLRALANQNATKILTAQLAAANIPLDSPQAKALLALVA